MGIRVSCHCGKIAFGLDDEPTQAIECNCSICRKRGAILAAAPADKLSLETPREAMSTYTFNTHKISHHFCTTCGCGPFSEGVGRDGQPMVMVNLRCADDFDLSAVEVMPFDGAKL